VGDDFHETGIVEGAIRPPSQAKESPFLCRVLPRAPGDWC
jgi:hypothetical protein